MNKIKSFCILLLVLLPFGKRLQAKDLVIFDGKDILPLIIASHIENPVAAAAEMLAEDFSAVTGSKPEISNAVNTNLQKPCILAGVIGKDKQFDKILSRNKIDIASLKQHEESFRIEVTKAGDIPLLLVIGSDSHGLAYGLLEISRRIGVSPWIWWADAVPRKKNFISFPDNFILQDYPSVRYRGIFLNDEDFGLMPWATKTLAPGSSKGEIGPKAYEKIFRLLLRLRANTIWPAMHKCTVPFYFVPGNADMAGKYGIYIGTSHCEPLECNIAAEWDVSRYGDYNYKTNSDSVLAYWKRRVEMTKDIPAIYTIGMRGEHDGKMEGAKTVDEQKELLQKVIDDQRKMLAETTGKSLDKIPQVFIPYKEVLDIYYNHLIVPDDITLMWCDDNFGYINRLSSPEEMKREGGSGIYYHLSYWGMPHDYLWLATTNPAQVWFEMKRAWDNGARRIWIANVGDIKPAEYLSEYFLDMAWNVGKEHSENISGESQVNETAVYENHLRQFMAREFGNEFAPELAKIMQQYYWLATIRKPEHMAWTRVYEPGFAKGMTPVKDTEFSYREIMDRIQAYANLESRVRTIEERLPGVKRASFYQLVSYPVYVASLINQKLLYAQLSRQNEKSDSINASKYAAAARFAYQEIKRLTGYYNKTMCKGKWERIMSDSPRDLYVFGEPVLPEKFADVTPDPIINPRVILRSADKSADYGPMAESDSCVAFAASAFTSGPGRIIKGLGYSKSAVVLKKGEKLEFDFETISKGPAELRVYCYPDHACDGGNLRYTVSLDGSWPVEMNIMKNDKDEEWKENVLRNQAIRKVPFVIQNAGKQRLAITAKDDDIVLDQLILDFRKCRKGYLVPGTSAL